MDDCIRDVGGITLTLALVAGARQTNAQNSGTTPPAKAQTTAPAKAPAAYEPGQAKPAAKAAIQKHPRR